MRIYDYLVRSVIKRGRCDDVLSSLGYVFVQMVLVFMAAFTVL